MALAFPLMGFRIGTASSPNSGKAPIRPAAWRRGATEFLRVTVVSSGFSPAWRAKTPEILWTCAVDRGQTGPDLLEEARPAQ